MTPEEPIARITIDVGDSINTQSAVGPLFDGSVVADDDGGDDAGDANVVQLRDRNFGRYLAVRDGGNVGTDAGASAATEWNLVDAGDGTCLLYTSPSPRDQRGSRMPSSA